MAGDMNEARANHAASLMADGRVLVTGGSDKSGNGAKSAEIYDPKSGEWTVTSPMKEVRYRHTSTSMADGRVLIAGSISSEVIEIFDPATELWTSTGSMGAERYNHSATRMFDGSILVVGGWRPTTLAKAGEIEFYDVQFGEWN